MKAWRWIGMGVALLSLCSLQMSVGAESPAAPPTTTAASRPASQQQSPPVRVGWLPLEKLGRGLGNVATGWLEVPATIERLYHEEDAATTIISGAFIGFFKAIGRTLVGGFETITFLLPIPVDYAPILPPVGDVWREKTQWSLHTR